MDLDRTWGRMASFEERAPGEATVREDFEPSGEGEGPEAAVLGVRGFGHLREEEPERGLRRWVVTLLGAAVLSASAAALSVAFGEEARDAAAAHDPLAALDALAVVSEGSESAEGEARSEGEEDAEKAFPPVDPADLSFPRALLDEPAAAASPLALGARPEVAVAMASAAAELEALEAEFGGTNPMSAAVLASGEASALERAAAEDPLVAGALPGPSQDDAVPRGRPGRYSLHVASYESPDEADAFAEALRARGHAAFVRQVDLGERGLRWRVQIGPFERLGRVRAYARRFEEQEDIHPVVLREERP